jgi:hypothetical protein
MAGNGRFEERPLAGSRTFRLLTDLRESDSVVLSGLLIENGCPGFRARMNTTTSLDRSTAVAVHEAGHAVGRYLTATELGYSLGDAISYIDVYTTVQQQVGTSRDGQAALLAQAATYGPRFSKPLQEFIRNELQQVHETSTASEITLSHGELQRLITKARAAGIDVDGWLRAKAISNLLGPMAEAKFLGRSSDQMLYDFAAQTDIEDTASEARLAGLSPQQIAAKFKEAMRAAEQALSKHEVWGAILALANQLNSGRMNGSVAVAIIAPYLKQTSL